MARRRAEAPPPTREEVLRFVKGAGEGMKRRELVSALVREHGDKEAVKLLVRDLMRDGVLGRRRPKRLREAPASEPPEPSPTPALDPEVSDARDHILPPVGVLDVVEIDPDGDLILRHPDHPALDVLLPTEALEGTAPTVGDRALVRVRTNAEGRLEARVIKLLERRAREVTGIVESAGDGWRIRSADRKARMELVVAPGDLGGADRGDLVHAEVLPSRRLGLPRAKVKERLGRPDEPKALSLLSVLGSGIPITFPPEVVDRAEAARPVPLGKRTDLRELPLVTIDGEDARDFDDAVWAAADTDPANPGGHKLVVAIADVAHYVRPGDPLDQEARKRGNSVYLPDRAIPMLPEALSTDLCSLRPDEERACLACEMTIDAGGDLKSWRFLRGLMRSKARLTYTKVQAAIEGRTDALTAPLVEPVLRPLYAAFDALLEGRRRRGTIELELPERKVVLGDDGAILGVEPRRRMASNMLIEEFMIAANVAAASVLAEASKPCLYRVHDKPDGQRLESLADFLERLGIPWSRSAKQPGEFTKLLNRLDDVRTRELASTLVLRAQAQAVYSPRNVGHFGLNLKRYAHFTSPIRRYSDLVVHRSLIAHLRLGEGGLPTSVDDAGLASLGEHLSRTERRAMEAERRAFERFVASFMASRVGAEFDGRVTTAVYFGLFVQLDDTGAEGLVPVSSLGDEPFALDERHQALVGQRSGEAYGLGDPVRVTLADADPIQGTLSFRLLSHEPGPGADLATAAWRKGGRRTSTSSSRGRPTRFRRR